MNPWIDPEGAPAEKVVNTIRECPSGALSYEKEGEVHTDYHDEAEIIVSKNGPHYVRGGIELKDASFGEGASREHYTLCRCGSSKNKPFCDGTHLDIDFNPDE
jgi:CDGSH-type Zn-finger protein